MESGVFDGDGNKKTCEKSDKKHSGGKGKEPSKAIY